jgi:hypothetical protein
MILSAVVWALQWIVAKLTFAYCLVSYLIAVLISNDFPHPSGPTTIIGSKLFSHFSMTFKSLYKPTVKTA